VRAACARVVGHYKLSNVAVTELKLRQSRDHISPPLTVIQANDTRWSSTFVMMCRLLKLKDYINTMGFDRDLLGSTGQTRSSSTGMLKARPNLTTEEWSDVRAHRDILLPFYRYTNYLQGEGYVTISRVAPIIWNLKHHLEAFITEENKPRDSTRKSKDVPKDSRILADHLWESLHAEFYLNKKRLDPNFLSIGPYKKLVDVCQDPGRLCRRTGFQPAHYISTFLDPAFKPCPVDNGTLD